MQVHSYNLAGQTEQRRIAILCRFAIGNAVQSCSYSRSEMTQMVDSIVFSVKN
jgi:hypothetical protein